MTLIRSYFLCAAAMLASLVTSTANLLADLSATQQQQVAKGELVEREEEIPDKPWPRLRIYKRIHASPEEVAAVFFDYEQAKTYIPDVLDSKISKKISPAVMEVDYAIDVPILRDEAYTARNEMKALDGGYVASWTLLRALQTKSAEGSLRIEPFEGGGSVIRYANLVTPSSGMAKILRGPALARMQKTVLAIGEKVENQKSNHPAELATQVARLRQALVASPQTPDDLEHTKKP
ncbi:MAG: SRPBCC family protein [bacterium]